ncbi:unnamed protein product [Boreogadus saida]
MEREGPRWRATLACGGLRGRAGALCAAGGCSSGRGALAAARWRGSRAAGLAARGPARRAGRRAGGGSLAGALRALAFALLRALAAQLGFARCGCWRRLRRRDGGRAGGGCLAARWRGRGGARLARPRWAASRWRRRAAPWLVFFSLIWLLCFRLAVGLLALRLLLGGRLSCRSAWLAARCLRVVVVALCCL